MNTVEKIFTKENIKKAYTYEEYLELIADLVDKKQTTGPNQSEDYAAYTRLNLIRMQRLDKTVEIGNELTELVKEIKSPQRWYVLLEGWCGDAAQSVPVIAKLATLNDHIELHLLLRDEHPVIMDQYLTNGGRSIPKLIGLDENGEELFVWGPRPAEAQALYDEFKLNPERGFVKFAEELQLWYSKNKTVAIQKELISVIKG